MSDFSLFSSTDVEERGKSFRNPPLWDNIQAASAHEGSVRVHEVHARETRGGHVPIPQVAHAWHRGINGC